MPSKPYASSLISGIAACSICFTLSMQAQAPLDPTKAPTPRAQSPSSAVISPDGKFVAWTIRQAEGTTLHLTEVANPDPAKERLIAVNGTASCSNSTPFWSPDSQTLAFLSTCTSKQEKPGQQQIFFWKRATGDTMQITHVTGILAEPAFSPDGHSIAFLFTENATRQPGGLAAQDPAVGVIGKDNIQIQTLAVIEGVDKGSNIPEMLTVFPLRPSLHVYHFDWAPNSKELAFTGAPAPGENNWWIAKLFTVHLPNHAGSADAASMDTPKAIFDPSTTTTALHGLQIAVPRFSPDGKHIAFIGGLMSDEGSTGGDIWVVDADKPNATPIDITPTIDGTPTWEVWLNNHTVGFVEDHRGHILLTDADLNTRNVVPNSSDDLGEVSVSGGGPLKNALSASNTGLIAFVESSFTHAPEIYVGPPNAPKPLTHLNDQLMPTSRTESIEWTSRVSQTDPTLFHVQGWLTYPKSYDPAKKYPMIVSVHGGPSSSIGPRWSTESSLPDAGYFVLQPNPRGSYGQGEAFTAANHKDFGYGDLRDILAGMDAAEAKASIDRNREGITGWSYGGFMTMFAVTQTHRFRAAVAGAGISNWQSYYGENSIDQWMVPFFGSTVYDDPAVYAKSSAITFIKQATTPMLILVGQYDGECPAPQSFEMWHALTDLGVKTQLVVYPNEGHGFTNPEHIRDRTQRVRQWFDENMK